MTDHIRLHNEAGVLTLTMARPDKKNALTNAMYGALADALEGAETDPTVRVLLIRGEGDMFTAGNDVGEFAAMATGGFRAEPQVGRFLQALAQSKAGLSEINARLTEGFTDAEIEIVARWLTSFQTKFPRGEDE